MKYFKNHPAFFIGIIFTALCWISMFTIIVPYLSILPGVAFERVARLLVSNDAPANVGKLTILLLTIIFVVVMIILGIAIKQTVSLHGMISYKRIILFMGVMYLLVHPLGYYICWWVTNNFRENDLKNIALPMGSFIFSSWYFIVIGLIFDIVIKKYKPSPTL